MGVKKALFVSEVLAAASELQLSGRLVKDIAFISRPRTASLSDCSSLLEVAVSWRFASRVRLSSGDAERGDTHDRLITGELECSSGESRAKAGFPLKWTGVAEGSRG